MIKKLCLCVFLCTACIWPAVAKEKHVIPEFTLGWYFPSINSMISLTDFKVALDFWLEEFDQYVELHKTDVRVYEKIDKMQADFNKGELSLIIAPPLLIVKYFDLKKLADGFMGTSITGQPYGMVILARKDKAINRIADLKNKRLVLPENDDLAHVFLDSLVISALHKNYQQVAESTEYLQKQNAIIHSLFFDQADVGVAYLETLNLMIELNPQIKSKIKILKNFPINSPNYSFFYKGFPDDQRKFFIEEVLKLNTSVRSQQIMNDFRMTSLASCSVESLEPFIRLNKQYEQLKNTLKNLNDR